MLELKMKSFGMEMYGMESLLVGYTQFSGCQVLTQLISIHGSLLPQKIQEGRDPSVSKQFCYLLGQKSPKVYQ